MNEEQTKELECDISCKKEAVFSNLQLRHLITYMSYNLCQLTADGKLSTKFSITELKSICDFLDIEKEHFKRRKTPCNEAWIIFLKNC